jgi:FtsP/CotA-like multicopper oxidase with cupredoxin domain
MAAIGALALLLLAASAGWAAPNPAMMGVIDGVNGPSFAFTATSGHVSTPEGNSVLFWGLADAGSPVQYPSPTLIVNQGDLVTVDVTNALSVPVSLVFPGHAVTATAVTAPTQSGVLTLEAAPGGTVRYQFVATDPGTYLYHSGTRPDLQVDMGLVGAIIVRPTGFDPMMPTAYGTMESMYDAEYLFLLTEMDPVIHRLVERGLIDQVDTNAFFPTYWFINGRAAPDTMFPAYAGWLPNQPYNSMPMIEPGKKLLMRVVGGGRDLHPFHQHGNHARVIARDGRLLDTGTGMLDLSYEVFTVQTVPGQTTDAIFSWTGAGMGWDIYGHAPGDPLQPFEDAGDHGKPFPVLLPENQDLTFGGFWSGSPFLGSLAALPPGEGGLNPAGGFVYMWHSHTEKEMVNNDIFPGGMMTMLVIVSPGTLATMGTPQVPMGVNPFFGGN